MKIKSHQKTTFAMCIGAVAFWTLLGFTASPLLGVACFFLCAALFGLLIYAYCVERGDDDDGDIEWG